MSAKQIEITLHPDARIKGDKEKLTAAVLALYREHGMLTPDILIKAARPAGSPLHDEFIWDADEALSAVQRTTALYLIRHITLEITEVDTGHVYRGREFILSPVNGDQYISIRAALSDVEIREQMIEQLTARLLALRDELARFDEFQKVVKAIEFVDRPRKKRKYG